MRSLQKIRGAKSPTLSRPFVYSDLETDWYKKWSKELKQNVANRGKFENNANKFWQNAIIAEQLQRDGHLEPGKSGLVFGVGEERLPALFAKHGASITATDQSYDEKKAQQWTNDQLAKGLKSLNRLAICKPEDFKRLVTFEPADMAAIPKKYTDSFDFVWSNCALGHLGSIAKGLRFIELSAACLKPGGTAVHTTELNFLSDEETLNNAETVFFRLKDILGVQTKLTKAGYVCEPFVLQLQTSPKDLEFTLKPAWGTRYSKILFDGYMATQILLKVSRPQEPNKSSFIEKELRKHTNQYKRNLSAMKRFIKANSEMHQLSLASRPWQPNKQDTAAPQVSQTKITLTRGKTKAILMSFTNEISYPLFSQTTKLRNTTPFVLATSSEVNRDSIFYDKTWWSLNRPSTEPLPKNKDAGFVAAEEPFSFEFVLNASKVKKGTYSEKFCIVGEGVGLVENSEFELTVEVV